MCPMCPMYGPFSPFEWGGPRGTKSQNKLYNISQSLTPLPHPPTLISPCSPLLFKLKAEKGKKSIIHVFLISCIKTAPPLPPPRLCYVIFLLGYVSRLFSKRLSPRWVTLPYCRCLFMDFRSRAPFQQRYLRTLGNKQDCKHHQD